MARVKICGITSIEDAKMAVEAGATALGFIFHKAVRDICRLARISTVQFHGEESPGYCKRFNHFKIIKAFRVSDVFDFKSVLQYKVDAYLFDTFQEETAGGTGKTFNWDLLKNYKFDKPVILSGGLNPENVRQAIEAVHPYAVDVSSGVEKAPGVKGYQLVQAFCSSIQATR
ncbi:MAG: phosphoribosylanthranilate isomerase [Candidatus Omnitrophica bacterium]|nr:phosphoribosylanthranilate isomerase [Candidatus Omnitrophota bacterium]